MVTACWGRQSCRQQWQSSALVRVGYTALTSSWADDSMLGRQVGGQQWQSSALVRADYNPAAGALSPGRQWAGDSRLGHVMLAGSDGGHTQW